jgi:hypothetical protein
MQWAFTPTPPPPAPMQCQPSHTYTQPHAQHSNSLPAAWAGERVRLVEVGAGVVQVADPGAGGVARVRQLVARVRQSPARVVDVPGYSIGVVPDRHISIRVGISIRIGRSQSIQSSDQDNYVTEVVRTEVRLKGGATGIVSAVHVVPPARPCRPGRTHVVVRAYPPVACQTCTHGGDNIAGLLRVPARHVQFSMSTSPCRLLGLTLSRSSSAYSVKFSLRPQPSNLTAQGATPRNQE